MTVKSALLQDLRLSWNWEDRRKNKGREGEKIQELNKSIHQFSSWPFRRKDLLWKGIPLLPGKSTCIIDPFCSTSDQSTVVWSAVCMMDFLGSCIDKNHNLPHVEDFESSEAVFLRGKYDLDFISWVLWQCHRIPHSYWDLTSLKASWKTHDFWLASCLTSGAKT